MKKKLLVTIILVIAITLVIISAVVIYFKNKSLDNDDIYFPEDVYTPSKLSDEEYNKLSKSIISKLEESFGTEGGFEIKNIEKGSLKIGDVATPQSYQKAEVYSKFLDDTFDGQPSSFISSLLRKYERELNEKIKEIAEKWELTTRRVQKLCAEGKIPGASKFGRDWAIPKDAEKPVDQRVTTGEYKNWRKPKVEQD